MIKTGYGEKAYGKKAAFGYLVGEKLQHFVSAAKKSRPEFATQLSTFVVGLWQLFSGDAMT